MMSELNRIGDQHDTDKAHRYHNYLVWYERFLCVRRNDELNILEMGVGVGASLKTWRDYFPNANIVGFDFETDRLQYIEPRVSIFIGDQANEADLTRVNIEHGPFDLIIDDAGHEPENQISAHRFWLPKLRSGGLYILEDVVEDSVRAYLASLACETMRKSDLVLTIAFYRDTSITQRQFIK